MIPLVDVTGTGIEIRKLVERGMKILVEDDGRTKCWVLQHIEGKRTKLSDLDNGFQQDLRRFQIE